MTSIPETLGNTVQAAIVNSIRLNRDTLAAICLYTNNNSKRSTMIAIETHNNHLDNSYMPNFEQEYTLCQGLTGKSIRNSSFRSVLN
jgi:hypothetical protein